MTALLADAPGAALAAALAGLAAALGTPPHAARRALTALQSTPPGSRDVPAGLQGNVRRTRALVPAAVVAGLGAWALLGGLAGAVAGAAAAGVVLALVPRLEPRAVRERRERMTADLPLAVDLLGACLAVGRPPEHALSAVCSALGGPLAADLGAVSVRLRLGGDPVTLWRDMAAQDSALAPLARTMARSIESGAPVVDALRLLAGDLRRDRRAVVEQRARGVAVRAAAPLGLCFLPAFVLVGIVPAVAEAFGALSWG